MTNSMDDVRNFSLALASSAMGFILTNQFVASLLLTVTLFFVGKGIDLFVKPVVREWRQKRRRRKRL